jgi:ribosomal protein S18 acetylase RimI-like enzyme
VTAIVGSFPFSESRHKEIIANFADEFTELGINRVFFLARFDRQPVGAVQLILHQADNDPELADGRNIAHVHSLWVRKHLHRRGLGSDLMRRVEREARERGFTTLTLGLEEDNVGAAAFYKKLEYVEFKRKQGRVSSEQLLLLRKRL